MSGSDVTDEPNPCRSPKVVRLLTIILAVAFLLRLGAVVLRFHNLSIDRDAYLAIGQNLVDGHGFCSIPGQPTAFRPPLYPFYIAACLATGGPWLIGAGQAVFGAATAWLTWLLARQCQFSSNISLLSATLVAVDPLLIEYSTQPMTETLFTFLSVLLLLLLCRQRQSRHTAWQAGVLFGLAALCRPSIWAFGILSAIVWLGIIVSQKSSIGFSKTTGPSFLTRVIPFGMTAAVVIAPWVIRNTFVFSRPIVMTTHGGYTLLLANNQTFYDEVVTGPDVRWRAESLSAWQKEVASILRRQDSSNWDETARDAALSRLARSWITTHPIEFIHASAFRASRFWAIRPSATEGIPESLLSLVGVYYLSLFLCAALGLIVHRHTWIRMWPLVVFVMAFTALHAVYWSNARMRSPIVPVISVVSAAGFFALKRLPNRRTIRGAIE